MGTFSARTIIFDSTINRELQTVLFSDVILETDEMFKGLVWAYEAILSNPRQSSRCKNRMLNTKWKTKQRICMSERDIDKLLEIVEGSEEAESKSMTQERL